MQLYQLLPEVPPELILGGKENLHYDLMRMAAFLKVKHGDPFMSGRYGVLSVEKDAKTIKNSKKRNILTGIFYGAPANMTGTEMCPSRTKGCTVACLWRAGQGRFNNVQLSRLKKTMAFLYDRERFMKQLDQDILALKDEAKGRGMKVAVRLNGTTDIAWENVDLFDHNYPNIFEVHPDVPFYDYTKRLERLPVIKEIPNYSVVFSRAETKKSQQDADKALAMGIPITVVFSELPMMYKGMPVINGDTDDWRPADILAAKGEPLVIGLIAKGPAKKDKSGFVVRPGDPGFNE